MRFEKEKRAVAIYCVDGSIIRGTIHINPGERVIDFLNDHKETFIAVTNSEFKKTTSVESFKLANESKRKKNFVVMNKSAVKMVEEL